MWEEKYSACDDYVFGTEPAQFLLENPGWLRLGARGLCVADGEGRNSVYLAKQGLDMTAFDLSPTAVGRAKKLAKEQGVSVSHFQSDWDSWDWDAPTFDLVAAIFIQFANPSERGKQFANQSGGETRWHLAAAWLPPGPDSQWHRWPAFCGKHVYR